MSLRLARVLVWTMYILASAGPAAGAITLRYALVVGSNSSPAVELPRLRFAESEAVRLADALVRLGRFEPERVVTLQGPDRRSVEAAVATLLARRRQDETVYGNIRTVFAFFYSGHGLRGQLTLRDGPLGREALAGIFRAFPADFRMGFFDACYSAGLPTDRPRSKGGVLPLPGVSVMASLPQSIVQSRGSMWLMSSGPDEPSFEDSALGGVFTHFFIEAMTRAPRDGPGIRLDQLWQYARTETLRHTSARGVAQHPEMFTQVRGEAFPYFSFPSSRTAQLWLGPSVGGQLLLSYADGGLQERIVKHAGRALLAHVYPGRAQLFRVEGGRMSAGRTMVLGAAMVRILGEDPPGAATMGTRHELLWRKGADGALGLTATVERPAPAWHLGVGYGYGLPAPGRLSLEHLAELSARLDVGGAVVEAGVGYGYGAEDFESWAYRLHGLRALAHAGYGWDLASTRLSLTGGLTVDGLFQSYDDGAERTDWSMTLLGRVGVVLQTHGRVKVGLDLLGGARYGPGAASLSEPGWIPTALARVTVLVGL